MADVKARASKFNIAGIVALSVGGVLAIVSIFVPSMFNDIISTNASANAALTASNTDKWQTIPGPFGIDINWNHYLFNCTNIWNVSQSLL
jgi:hypothetical protein